MKLLVDTQSVIWFAENNPQLSKTAREILEDDKNICLISMATFWEIGIKVNLGKLNINGLTLSQFINEVELFHFLTLDIKHEHTIENSKLPLHHRDPFDRIIISQAIVEQIAIISNDGAFDDYEIRRIW
jgi:PIN domain nuclease of toxin-antitoxin system